MDTEKIKAIMQMFEESQISKMDLQDGDLKLTLEKEVEPEKVVRTEYKKTQKTQEEEKEGTEGKSQLVGTYYQASGQGQEPFVKVGDQVSEGDTLCIIEAMKVMNEIKAPVSGKVLSIEIQDGQNVEYDQILMRIG